MKKISKTIVYSVIATVSLVLISYLYLKLRSESTGESYFISTQTESDDRIKDLNLDQPSEDASYILDISKISFPKDYIKLSEITEFKADPQREWIINIIPANGVTVKKEDIDKIFDYNWRKNFDSTIYGFSTKENAWTYANAGDSPEVFSKLQVAVTILDTFNEENPNYNSKKLQRYIDELKKRLEKYPVKLKIEPSETIEFAIAKAKKLVELHKEFNVDAIVVLKADKEFVGLDAWDALQSVGLKWGDGDVFHWDNTTDFGDQQYFSVWTTTEPGYFLPEEIQAGTMKPQNLVFGFSIPRSVDPQNVYDIMLKSVKYCQKRLGGKILDRNNNPLNEEKERFISVFK